MINNKKLLYEILIKYDNVKSMSGFCDSLSKVIQDRHTDDDLIEIISMASFIETDDIELLNNNIGIYEVIF
jgi:hypothetical protein